MKTRNLTTRFVIIFCTTYLILPTNCQSFGVGNIDIIPRVILSQSFDDNITFVKEDKKKGFITDLSLGLDMKYGGKTQRLGFSGTINQQVFSTEKEFNNISQDFDFNFQKEFSEHDRIKLTNEFIHAQKPRSFEDAFGQTSGRYSYYLNKLNLEYTRDISKQLDISIRYANVIYKNSRNSLSDSYGNSASVQTDYSFSSTTRCSALYDFDVRMFSAGSKAFTHNLTGGITQYLSQWVRLDVKLGISMIRSFNNQNDTKPYFFVGLTKEINETTFGGISFERQFSPNRYSEDLFDSWRISTSLARQILERLSCELSAFHGEGEYTSSQVTDKVNGVDVFLTYDFYDNLSGNIGYTYAQTDSTQENQDYAKNTILFGLILEF